MIVHLHVPKTAGTTFNYVLRKAFPDRFFEGIFEPGLVLTPDQARAFIETQRNMCAVSSHALRFPCPPIEGLQYEYAAILREPVERVVSLYFHEKRVHAADPNHRSKKPLAEFIEIARNTNFGNSQCNHLHASGDVVKAKQVLEQLDFVGTTEQFEEGMILARTRLNLPFSALVQPRLNKSKSGSALDFIDQAMFQELRRAFEPDVELHTYAQSLLTQAIARQSRRYFVQTRALHFANQIADREYRIAAIVRGKAQGARRRLTNLMRAPNANP